MNVTVCQLHDEPEAFTRDWDELVQHVRDTAGDLVLLPEMPFYPWFGRTRTFDPGVWQAAVAAHDSWQTRLSELAPAVVISTRPVNLGQKRLNEGFVWDAALGYQASHVKAYLPDEDGTWEASWYSRGDGTFTPTRIREQCTGFLICTELWMMEQARLYGLAGVHVLVTPRLTGPATLDKWLAGGRTSAVVAGAFSLSSNRIDEAGTYGGQGWVIGPDGDVLDLTSRDRPYVTVTIDLAEADRAKKTYPRYAIAQRLA